MNSADDTREGSGPLVLATSETVDLTAATALAVAATGRSWQNPVRVFVDPVRRSYGDDS